VPHSCFTGRRGVFSPARVEDALATIAAFARTNNAEQIAINAQRAGASTTHFALTSMKTKAVVAITMMIISAAAAGAASCDWKAPPTAVNRPNPVPSNANTIALGQKLYTANCFTCHGENGKGDGPGAAALEKKPADLGACIKANNETDGSLFWKISEGRSPMVSWKASLSETQRWELVNSIKTLAGK